MKWTGWQQRDSIARNKINSPKLLHTSVSAMRLLCKNKKGKYLSSPSKTSVQKWQKQKWSYKTWKMVYRVLKKFQILFLKYTPIISQMCLNVFQSWERYCPYAFVMGIFSATHLIIWSFKQLKWKFSLTLWKCAM